MHDKTLDRTTNILDFPEFASKKSEDGYLVNDFTLEELKQFKLRSNEVEGRLKFLDDKFSIPTLKEVLTSLLHFNDQH